MADLTLRNIHKYYGDVHAVKGVSLTIPVGEFTVLVGPSGCGKSTLLRSIAGLEAISEGEIILGGKPITRLRPRDRDLAMVFQNYALYPYLSVYENIAFGLRARKTPREDVDGRVRRAADMLDIAGLLKRYPRELSGGQRQRVAIGRAIVRDAQLYLFDEPLSNLDAKLRDEMREEIKRLHQELKKTFIYVTHDQIEAMTLADRIVLLRDGRIEQEGAPLDLFERPINKFVAGFLGSPGMNFLPVELAEDGAAITLPDGQKIDTTEAQRHLLNGRRTPLLWGVRPEHFRLDADAANAIDVTFEVIQPTGSRLYGSSSSLGVHIVAELDAHAISRPNERVRLGIVMAKTIFIDPETESIIGNGA